MWCRALIQLLMLRTVLSPNSPVAAYLDPLGNLRHSALITSRTDTLSMWLRSFGMEVPGLLGSPS